jgi:hypothetical protein
MFTIEIPKKYINTNEGDDDEQAQFWITW